ncbi:hypothetical protein NL676_006261 [Syzygium grande]|nr:hypothetical protein NL676_006261 [Syzygium grande]
MQPIAPPGANEIAPKDLAGTDSSQSPTTVTARNPHRRSPHLRSFARGDTNNRVGFSGDARFAEGARGPAGGPPIWVVMSSL